MFTNLRSLRLATVASAFALAVLAAAPNVSQAQRQPDTVVVGNPGFTYTHYYRGARVDSVKPNSSAARTLEPGNVILTVNGTNIGLCPTCSRLGNVLRARTTSWFGIRNVRTGQTVYRRIYVR